MLSNNSDISDYNLFFTTIQLRTRKIIIQMVEDMACNGIELYEVWRL